MALRHFLLAVAGAAAFFVPADAAPPAAVSAYLPTTCQPGVSGDCVRSTPVTNPDGTNIGTIPQLTTTDRGGSFGTSAAQLMPANASRHFIVVQVQSATASCYINGTTTATADYHSLQIAAGAYYESSTHVGTGAISIICTGAATSVYAREG